MKTRPTPARFLELLEDELAAVPAPLRGALANVAVEVRDEPGLEAQDLDDVPDDLLSLYAGPTREEMLGSDGHGSMPASIFLYRRRLEDVSETADELRRELHLALRQEIAYYFGFDDEELRTAWPEKA